MFKENPKEVQDMLKKGMKEKNIFSDEKFKTGFILGEKGLLDDLDELKNLSKD